MFIVYHFHHLKIIALLHQYLKEKLAFLVTISLNWQLFYLLTDSFSHLPSGM